MPTSENLNAMNCRSEFKRIGKAVLKMGNLLAYNTVHIKLNLKIIFAFCNMSTEKKDVQRNYSF